MVIRRYGVNVMRDEIKYGSFYDNGVLRRRFLILLNYCPTSLKK